MMIRMIDDDQDDNFEDDCGVDDDYSGDSGGDVD